MENPNVYVGSRCKPKKAAVLKAPFTKSALFFITIASWICLVSLAHSVLELSDFSLKVTNE